MINIKERLRQNLTMSQFATLRDLLAEFNNQREEAADRIQILETTNMNLHDHIAAQYKRIADLEAHINQAVTTILQLQSDQFYVIDAERYRWIRDNQNLSPQPEPIIEMWRGCLNENRSPNSGEWDAAIDAAMKAAK